MKNLKGNEVRQMFLDYFKSKGHMIEPGASLVPHNDPTLLWINAGVAALKKYFDGSIKPDSPRIANAQKSIRTNDIENVGKTARHHTFFEMLGNFSIGDYFKEDAIKFAWEFLTDEKYIGFDKDKLYITVYSDDEEAYNIWTNILKVDPSHLLKTPNNYWEIGEGPCGPDTEIFYDRGEKYDPEGQGLKLFYEELENDRYIEVWNVVFSQYESKEGIKREDYKELPQRNIDTGMGLERLTCIIQGGDTNYDTDLFLPIINETEKYTNIKYGQEEYLMAFRVIADHIRTVTFALADGALFSNEGRGYVLRRVLRRAVRYGIKLDIKESFMYKLVNIVAANMVDYYPYVSEKVDYISKLVKAEEDRFHTTLNDGEKLLIDVINKSSNKVIDGVTAFKLYDTYGFPFELTLEIAEEYGYDVDQDEFNNQMKIQKERAKNARVDSQSMSSQSIDLLNYDKESVFSGYTNSTCNANVDAMFVNGVKVDELSDEGEVILSETVLYAEMGGQVGDKGTITSNGCVCNVIDVIKAPNKQNLHKVKVVSGTLKVNDNVNVQLDIKSRRLIEAAHSATHLLQVAITEVVGDHINQAGSFVTSEYLRFDFTHFEKLTKEDIEVIESKVNNYIFDNLDVTCNVMDIESAKQTGAKALFDEKYGKEVRVVAMGETSKEFCGGCHVNNTSQIGFFKIVSEESVGSGIRRITAKVSSNAYQEVLNEEKLLSDLCSAVNVKSIATLKDKVVNIVDKCNSQEKELAELNNQMLVSKANDLFNEALDINGMKLIVKQFDNVDGNALKTIASSLKANNDNIVLFLISKFSDKLVFVAAAGKDAISNGIHAGNLVKEAAIMCNGNGGGKPDLAQAGGKDINKVNDVIEFIKNKIA